MKNFSASVEGKCEEFHKELHIAFGMPTKMFRETRKLRRYWSHLLLALA